MAYTLVIFYVASTSVLPEELVTLLDEEIEQRVTRFAADGRCVNYVVKTKVEADGELLHRALRPT